jgi:hypothetical protein
VGKLFYCIVSALMVRYLMWNRRYEWRIRMVPHNALINHLIDVYEHHIY